MGEIHHLFLPFRLKSGILSGMKRVERIAVSCAVCGAEMLKTAARIRAGRGRYCSKECGGKAAVARGQITPWRGRHRKSRTPIHDIWMGMRARCTNPNCNGFALYGGRGIKVCDRWQAFENFLADMGERPSSGHSIDRIDVDGDYEPGNCRWATQSEQMQNTRRTHFVLYEGKNWCVTELARHLGLKHETLRARIRLKWPVERWAQPPMQGFKACHYALQSKNL